MQNETEKNPRTIMLIQFWSPKVLFCTFEKPKNPKYMKMRSGNWRVLCQALENNLKATGYWKRGAWYALAPTLFLPIPLPTAQSETKWWGRGSRGLNRYSCSYVLPSVHQSPAMNIPLITQPGQALARGTQGHAFLSVWNGEKTPCFSNSRKQKRRSRSCRILLSALEMCWRSWIALLGDQKWGWRCKALAD